MAVVMKAASSGGEPVDDGPGGHEHPLADREIGGEQRVRPATAAVGLDGRTCRVDRDDQTGEAEAHGVSP